MELYRLVLAHSEKSYKRKSGANKSPRPDSRLAPLPRPCDYRRIGRLVPRLDPVREEAMTNNLAVSTTFMPPTRFGAVLGRDKQCSPPLPPKEQHPNQSRPQQVPPRTKEDEHDRARMMALVHHPHTPFHLLVGAVVVFVSMVAHHLDYTRHESTKVDLSSLCKRQTKPIVDVRTCPEDPEMLFALGDFFCRPFDRFFDAVLGIWSDVEIPLRLTVDNGVVCERYQHPSFTHELYSLAC